jgi:glutaredoxin-like protein DUF836
LKGGKRPPSLILYSRAYCHLCQEMLAEIEGLREEFSFALQIMDVDADPELERRFGELVPVLAHGERELARYRLDKGSLRAYLSRFR